MDIRALCVAAVGVSSVAIAGVTAYDEGVDGDLSGDRFSPTVLAPFGEGIHSLTATSVMGDVEYVTISIGAGLTLDAIILESFASQSQQSFIAVQSGQTFTEAPDTVDVTNLLGWTHFGTGPGHVGTDILDDMGMGSGAIGFVPPLGPGDYTFWIQETGPNPATYELRFVVTPAPATLLPLVLAPLVARRRR